MQNFTLKTFEELGLSPELLHAVKDMGFEKPSPIQAKAIPQLLTLDPHLIGLAQTGTGKTAAFVLPILQMVDTKNSSTQSIIVAPTRELVQQICREVELMAKYIKGLNVKAIYGGTPVGPQVRSLKAHTPHILAATPGRLIDMIKRDVIHLDQVNHVVLDEADEMLNMGFQEDIDNILSFTPEHKKIWLFSATMPKQIRRIIAQYMVNPVEVSIDAEQKPNANILHKYIIVQKLDKEEALKRVISILPDFYGVVFCKTRMDTQELSEALTKDGFRAAAIHGDIEQNKRDKVMNRFRSRDISILVATDVAARGIDVDDLTHVINFSLPENTEYYTHRSGRTARAGKEGISLSLVTPGEVYRLKNFERSLKINIEKMLAPKFTDLLEEKIQRWESKINDIDTSEFPKEQVERSKGLFSDLSKEELIIKLLTNELKKIKRKSEKEDINVDGSSPKGGRGGDRNRGDRGDRRDRGRRDRRSRGDDRGDSSDRDGDRKSSRYGDRRSSGQGEDIQGGKSRRRSSESLPFKSDRPNKSSGVRDVFINIGKVDNTSKGDIVKLVSKACGIKGEKIGKIQMHKQHSIVQVSSHDAMLIEKSGKNIKIDGRKIKIHLE